MLIVVLLVCAALCGVATAIAKPNPWVFAGIGIVLLAILEAMARYPR